MKLILSIILRSSSAGRDYRKIGTPKNGSHQDDHAGAGKEAEAIAIMTTSWSIGRCPHSPVDPFAHRPLTARLRPPAVPLYP
jgi:hypothetical protein